MKEDAARSERAFRAVEALLERLNPREDVHALTQSLQEQFVSADALLQDVVEHANESVMSELSAAIGRLPQQEQVRILNAVRALTE